MTDKQKEAIKRMTEVRDKNVHTFVDELTTVLNLIQTQQAEIEQLKNKNKHQSKEIQKAVDYTFELNTEIEKKDKIIDEMAYYLSDFDIDEMCEKCDRCIGNGCYADGDVEFEMNCIKQYFEMKVETEDK